MENTMSQPQNDVIKGFFVIRDTASGFDTVDFTATHLGEAFARLASLVIGLQRISFELYHVGNVHYCDDVMTIKPCSRKYICSASQAMLESHFEDEDVFIDDDSGANPNDGNHKA